MGTLKSVRFLIDNGADTSIKDHNGETALDCAKKRSHQDVIDTLSKHEES